MDSGRANPRAESVPASAPGSPNKSGRAGIKALTSTAIPQLAIAGGSKGISADSRRRIWAAMNGFRPKFRQIARTLDEVDLVFIEEAMERWMLQYDRAFACRSLHYIRGIWLIGKRYILHRLYGVGLGKSRRQIRNSLILLVYQLACSETVNCVYMS